MYMIKVGDEVFIDRAYEDDNGAYGSVSATVSKVNKDGTLKFRIGHWKTRKQKDQIIQAWINKMEWYEKDVEIIKK
jgi:hypothetical protein